MARAGEGRLSRTASSRGARRCVADAYVELQDARELAEYDNTYDISKPVAVKHVQTARQAVEAARRLAVSRDPVYLLFLRLMVGSAKVARKR